LNSQASSVQPGHLYVVATPIGNLQDLSPRAQAVLAAVDLICAEDTRTSGTLLAHFGLRKPLRALHEHNEDQIAAALVEKLRAGLALALISDAGTPLVSDPGFALVRAARAAGVPVIAVPGPCAAIAALSISGLPSDRFLFVGFLPARSGARRAALEALAGESATLVLYESSHRIAECLDDIVAVLGAERRCCLARELTKLFEESHTASAAELRGWLEHPHREKGEFVLVIEGNPAPVSAADAEVDRLLRILGRELGASQAARLAAEITQRKKRELYQRALALVPGAGTDHDRAGS
jgi:16S rRNA (cytidine1402-2'-O)-methyltransferase